MLSWRQTPVHPRSADACIAQKWACTRLVHFNETSHPPLPPVDESFPSLALTTGALEIEADAVVPVVARVTEARTKRSRLASMDKANHTPTNTRAVTSNGDIHVIASHFRFCSWSRT